jgi:hypothetical protein
MAAGAGATALGAGAGGVALIVDPADPIASSAPVKWAVSYLEQQLTSRQLAATVHPTLSQASASDLCIVIAGATAAAARQLRLVSAVALPSVPEALLIAPAHAGSRSVLLASGADARGLVYAVLELADRVRYSPDPHAALEAPQAFVEQPANRIRSISRCFESDVEDKPWFYDRAMWDEYLTMLASQRVNRFSLTLGLGYNFPRHVTDAYFYFPYPFLFSVSGYDVRASGLPDPERARNLETLQYIGDQTVKRGMQFQIGLWTHAYEWIDSPNANYLITGLDASNHAAYCRDALLTLLKACPAITGATFRVHGESGVPEGNYDFWKTLFEGIVRSGRQVEIDMHAKGMDQEMIDVALATGMPVNVSPKYWAEHMGLPYQQASIRELEMPPRTKVEGVFSLSNGSRRFLRYGYGDLLKEGRKYGVLYRIWPGTQRFLLWADPAMAAGYGRYSHFCGSDGVELYEPLSFKGRIGSGRPGGRCAYKDVSLNPKYDWQKYLHTYRVWGRLTYNPDAGPYGWRRYLNAEFKDHGPRVEKALASASRVLLLVTTAHGPSASNNVYWPEIYTNMPIVDPARKHPYRDTPEPRRYGTVSSFDPQLFSTIDEFTRDLLSGERNGKQSPLQVAQWLDDCAAAASAQVTEAARPSARSIELRRVAADVAIQAGIGRFFAHKNRAAVLWAIYSSSGDQAALQHALNSYRAARQAWAEMAKAASEVYVADITYGATPHLRGDWLDRLQAIDDDIADMEKYAGKPSPTQTAVDPARVANAIQEVLRPPARSPFAPRHTPAPRFRPGQALDIQLSLAQDHAKGVLLYYRRVNQAEAWKTEDMTWRDNAFRAAIPQDYTRSEYPLQYYFELRHADGRAYLYPGFSEDLSNQPYFVVRSV